MNPQPLPPAAREAIDRTLSYCRRMERNTVDEITDELCSVLAPFLAAPHLKGTDRITEVQLSRAEAEALCEMVLDKGDDREGSTAEEVSVYNKLKRLLAGGPLSLSTPHPANAPQDTTAKGEDDGVKRPITPYQDWGELSPQERSAAALTAENGYMLNTKQVAALIQMLRLYGWRTDESLQNFLHRLTQAKMELDRIKPASVATQDWMREAAKELAIWYAQRDDTRTEHDAGQVEAIITRHAPASTEDSQRLAKIRAAWLRDPILERFLAIGFWDASHVDIIWRRDGQEVRKQADWLKDIWYALQGISKSAAMVRTPKESNE